MKGHRWTILGLVRMDEVKQRLVWIDGGKVMMRGKIVNKIQRAY